MSDEETRYELTLREIKYVVIALLCNIVKASNH